MIVAKIHSGLGNQLFEYAMARHLSLLHNTPLLLDINEYSIKKPVEKAHIFELPKRALAFFRARKNGFKFYETFNKRTFELGNFCISALIASEQEIDLAKKSFELNQKNFHFDPEVFNVPKTCYVNGHWLSEKFFKPSRNILVEELSLKKPFGEEAAKLAASISTCETSVSLHIRRGDYVNEERINRYHGVCSLEYYKQAVEYILAKKSNVTLFVFSDDIGWAKNNLKLGVKTVFVSNPNLKSYEELILMSMCSHNIIANSSFSWWGAWLNTNSEKIVIAPQKWFNVTDLDTKDVVPEEWIKI